MQVRYKTVTEIQPTPTTILLYEEAGWLPKLAEMGKTTQSEVIRLLIHQAAKRAGLCPPDFKFSKRRRRRYQRKPKND